MNARERLRKTLSFENCHGEGAVLETFYPWSSTVERWKGEGLPEECVVQEIMAQQVPHLRPEQRYLDNRMTAPVATFEKFLGFDPMRRLFLQTPCDVFEREVLEEGNGYRLVRHPSGAVMRELDNGTALVEIPPVQCEADWEEIKRRAYQVMEQYYKDEYIEQIYGAYAKEHRAGAFSIRFALKGFFWFPRELFSIEGHLLAFYDYPELMHDMNEFLLQMYFKYMDKVLQYIQPDVVYILEDLSGANGPMLSGTLFDEFVGAYYRRLVPFLKGGGVGFVFVDTDGDFQLLIPRFLDAGIDGFLPMDVNAGMDIVKVRRMHPTAKFIGAYNKLEIAKGKEAIDREFARILPVVRQGGYIPGSDHQVAPSTSLENYQYYISRLHEVMRQAGADL